MKIFLYGLVEPRALKEDLRRREFIFNIIIVSIIFLILGATISSAITSLFVSSEASRENSAVPIISMIIELGFFYGLYLLSRKGFTTLASYIFISVLFLLGSYVWYRWGVDLPFGILSQVLVIVISGILISTRFAFITMLVVGLTMAFIGHLQTTGYITLNNYWRSEVWTYTDTIVAIIIFLIIAVVSWLSNREIEKSLARARRSEAELKHERDNLEIIVEERTKELKEAQAERMAELYRFAEFGRLSSGLFHDLITPLNAVSLNMEKLKTKTDVASISDSANYVDKAIISAKKLEDLVTAVRKQLTRQTEKKVVFSLNEEIRYVEDVLSHKAQKVNVIIDFTPPQNDIKLTGDPIKFNQVVLNLVANAIDSYTSKDKNSAERKVIVLLNETADKVMLQVKDNGSGISDENISKIFEPFFTTKAEGNGMGIGLSMTKRIVEKDFGGTITVSSKVGEGSTFTVELPK